MAFDEWVLDTDSRELLRRGGAVPLSPKALQLLQTLLESRPRALSRQSLQELLWPDAVVVDTNLSNLIGEVRAALGDDPRTPRFIRTVHRFGYAFRAEPAAAAIPTGATTRVRLRWPGGSVELGEGEHVLGRDPEAAVCLVSSSSVSRRHAVLRVLPGRVTLEDLRSKNGTSLNGQPVERPRAVGEGDEIRVGSVRLDVHLVPPAVDTETEVAGRDRRQS